MAFGSVEVLLYYVAGTAHPTPVELQPFLTAPSDIVDIVGHYNVYPADNAGNMGQPAGVPDPTLISMVHGQAKKIVLPVGGGDEARLYKDRFSAIVQSNAAMGEFVKQVMDVVNSGGYDGIDLDWEFPATNADRQGYANLIYKFAMALNPNWPTKSGKTLSVGVQVNDINGGYTPTTTAPNVVPDLLPTVDYLDWYGVQTYGQHGPSFSDHSGHSGAIHSTSGDNLKHWPIGPPNVRTPSFDSALTYWLGRNVPRSKIRLGIGFYGMHFTTVDSLLEDTGDPDPSHGESVSYTEIQGLLASGGWASGFDGAAIGAYYTKPLSPITLPNGFVSSPTAVTVQASLRFAAAEHLPGMIVWAAGKDWVSNQQPLLIAMRDAAGRARSLWVGARDFISAQPGASPPVTLQIVGDTGSGQQNKAMAWVFPHDQIGMITASVTLPTGWDSTHPIIPVLHWSAPVDSIPVEIDNTWYGNTTGLDMRWTVLDVGDQVDETGAILNPGLTPGPVGKETLAWTPMGAFQPAAARTIRITVVRSPVAAIDRPLSASVWVFGLELQYVSTS